MCILRKYVYFLTNQVTCIFPDSLRNFVYLLKMSGEIYIFPANWERIQRIAVVSLNWQEGTP